MHMRIAPHDSPAEAAMTQLGQLPGLVSAYVLRPMDQQRPLLVSVWGSTVHAEQAPVAAGGRDYPDCRFEGTDNGEERPTYGQIVYFDGPRPPAEAAAIDRANHERIAPAVRGIPGTLGAYVGRTPDGSSAVVALTTSLQAIEDAQRAIMSTDLLPGEDPALFSGPDRMHIGWVLAASPSTAPLAR